MLAGRCNLKVECRLFLIACGLALACGAGCRPETTNGDAMPKRDINSVMEAHVEELMAIPGVTGVAIGETDQRVPCILVLILEDSEEITGKLPKEIEGHPVRTMVTGEIVPMQDD
jgi:hypothetical protein